jgi:hypothetical protein
MANSSIFWLGLSSLILVFASIGVLVYLYTQRLSRIDEKLRTIAVTLSEIPKENSLREYMFNHDQRLRSIGEKLDTQPDPDMLQWHIEEHTEQLRTILSKLEDDSKPELTRAELVDALRPTNDSLEKVLWSLRFDESKYTESSPPTGKRCAESVNKKSNRRKNYSENDREPEEDTESMKAILTTSNDSYNAMLEYMQRTGKSGINALHALDAAVGMHSR